MVELHIHSSNAVISALFRKLNSILGVRMAEPGEFSRRAFHNGKLDLAQLEGLADLVASDTESQRRLALHQLSGTVSRAYESWRREVISAMAMAEAWIDFSDDELIEEDTLLRVRDAVAHLSAKLKKHMQELARGEIVRNGLRVTLCGPPNAGKSSILNKLVKRDAAIVSPVAGTTRDVIQVNMEISGFSVIFYDTAGLRDVTNEDDIGGVEQEGIRRALKAAETSDQVFFVLDATTCASETSWTDHIKLLDPSRLCIVLNKSDLLTALNEAQFRPLLPPPLQNVKIITHSCLSESPLTLQDALARIIEDKFFDFFQDESLPVITQERHRRHIEESVYCLERFLSIYQDDIVVGAEELRRAAHAIGRITGHIDPEQVLDVLFSRFCIGK